MRSSASQRQELKFNANNKQRKGNSLLISSFTPTAFTFSSLGVTRWTDVLFAAVVITSSITTSSLNTFRRIGT